MPSKYCKDIHTMDLLSGIRKSGLSIEECCVQWGISYKTYYNWVEKHPEFREACEIGETHYRAWWQGLYRNAATGDLPNANDSLIKHASTTVLEMREKKDQSKEDDRIVNVVTINVLPSYADKLKLTNEKVIDG